MIELTSFVAMEGAGADRREQAATREARFGDLVERQSRFLFRVAYAVVRNSADAEDVVQETFLKVFRTGAWENMRDEKAFLARAAWRVALGKLPDRRNAELGREAPVIREADPETAAVQADWNEVVHRLMDGLPEHLRQPLALSAVEELTSRQISQILGIREGTVRSRILRARQILREKLTVVMEGGHGR